MDETAKNELSLSLSQVKEKPGENIPPGSIIFFKLTYF